MKKTRFNFKAFQRNIYSTYPAINVLIPSKIEPTTIECKETAPTPYTTWACCKTAQ